MLNKCYLISFVINKPTFAGYVEDTEQELENAENNFGGNSSHSTSTSRKVSHSSQVREVHLLGRTVVWDNGKSDATGSAAARSQKNVKAHSP